MDRNEIRVLLYSHDALGLGHLRRNLAIAHQIAQDLPEAVGKPVGGLLSVGVLPPAGTTPPPGLDWLVLPGLVKQQGQYVPRRLQAPAQVTTGMRSSLLEAALCSLEPDLVLVDRHLLGMNQELRRPLERLRATCPRSRVVLGLREVLDAPEVAAREWQSLGRLQDLVHLVDEVWVYGDRQVHDPLASGEVPAVLHDRTVFTGYLADGRREHDPEPTQVTRPYVLTTAGGGADGELLLRAAVAMRVPYRHQHLVVTGPHASPRLLETLRRTAPAGTLVLSSVPGLSRYIEQASALITMGGYNTACELMATSTPALVVPRERPRTEQLIRARALERVGAVEVLRQHQLSPQRLSRWASQAVHRSTSRSHLRRDGLRTTAAMAATVVGTRAAKSLTTGK